MRDSNLEFRIVDLGPSNFGYAAIISLESGLLSSFSTYREFRPSPVRVRVSCVGVMDTVLHVHLVHDHGRCRSTGTGKFTAAKKIKTKNKKYTGQYYGCVL